MRRLRRLRLFLAIVFRDFHGVRVMPLTAWKVSGLVWGRDAA